MANKDFWYTQSRNKELKLVGGSFAPQGTGTTAPTGDIGLGWTVTQTQTGEFLITFDAKYPYLAGVTASIQNSSATAVFSQIGIYDANAGTLVIRTVNGSGALSGLSAGANNRVNFMAFFVNTTVLPV